MTQLPPTFTAFLYSDFTGTDEEQRQFDEVIFLPGLRAQLRSAVSPDRPHPDEADYLEIRQQYRAAIEAEKKSPIVGPIKFFRGDLLGVAATKRLLASNLIEPWRYDAFGTLWFQVVNFNDE